MKRVGFVYLFLLFSLAFSLPSLAQDSTPETTPESTSLPTLNETYISKNGTVSFSYPEGWQVSEQPGNSVIAFVGDITMPNDGQSGAEHRSPGIDIIIWDKVDQLFVTPGTDDIAYGVALWNREDDTTVQPPDNRIIGDVTTLTVGNKRAAWFLTQFGYADTLHLAVEEAQNTVSYLELGTDPGETDEWKETLLAIAESIQLHETQPDIPMTESS